MAVTSEPAGQGWRSIILEQVPEDFAKAIRPYNGKLDMTQPWRDAHQSLLATGLRTIDLLNIASATSHTLSNVYSLELRVGVTFNVAIRFSHKDP